MTKINLDELRADREAGTDGPWRYHHDKYEGDAILASNKPIRWVVRRYEDPDTGYDVVDIPNEADARRIARLPDLEAAYLEAVEALRVANDAITEMFRYYDGGEARGSYDGKPERDGLRKAGYKTRALLANLK